MNEDIIKLAQSIKRWASKLTFFCKNVPHDEIGLIGLNRLNRSELRCLYLGMINDLIRHINKEATTAIKQSIPNYDYWFDPPEKELFEICDQIEMITEKKAPTRIRNKLIALNL